MPAADWTEWARRHALIFGLHTKEDAAMLLEWCDLFAAEGHSPAELTAATDRLTRDPPRFRSDHLAGLRRLLAEARREALDRPPPGQDRGVCEDCGGTGRAEVPLGGLSTPGGNVFPESQLGVVLCHCPLGKWMGQRGSPLLSFEAYTLQRPHWRDDLAAVKQLTRGLHRAHQRAGQLDKTLGEILKRAKTFTGGNGSASPE